MQVGLYEPFHEKINFLHRSKKLADQDLGFHYTDSTIPLLPNPKFQSSSTAWFVTDLVGNPVDRCCRAWPIY